MRFQGYDRLQRHQAFSSRVLDGPSCSSSIFFSGSKWEISLCFRILSHRNHHHWSAPICVSLFQKSPSCPSILRQFGNRTSVTTLDIDVRSALNHDPDNITLSKIRSSRRQCPLRIATDCNTGHFRAGATIKQQLHCSRIYVWNASASSVLLYFSPSAILHCSVGSTLLL